jgi:hypothetical protein
MPDEVRNFRKSAHKFGVFLEELCWVALSYV